MSEQNIDLVFADIVLDNGSGTDILKEIGKRGLLCPVVMITGQPDIETAAESVRFGAYDYMIKPVHKEALIRITRMALDHQALLAEKERYRNHLEAIFRSVTEAIITIDHRKQITEANDAVGVIFGISPETMIGRLSDDVFRIIPKYVERF
ncbi:MAG: response regulator [Desulfobacteraceae bacterium]|nr:response regulator [Desulfobacteraceae bacterium]